MCVVHTLPQGSGPEKLSVLKEHSVSPHALSTAGAHGKTLYATYVFENSSTKMGKLGAF